jgi:hypothetical protein
MSKVTRLLIFLLELQTGKFVSEDVQGQTEQVRLFRLLILLFKIFFVDLQLSCQSTPLLTLEGQLE